MGSFGKLVGAAVIAAGVTSCEGTNPGYENTDSGVSAVDSEVMPNDADAQQDATKPVLPEGCELLLVENLCKQTGALAIEGTDSCCPPDFINASSCHEVEDCHCCIPVETPDEGVDLADAAVIPADAAVETPDAGTVEHDAATVIPDEGVDPVDATVLPVDAAVQPPDADNIPREEVCGDGVDNDNNGLTDCFDPRCAGETAVAVDFIPGTEVTVFGQLPVVVQQEITARLSCEEMVGGFELGFLAENLGGETQLRVHNNVMGVGVGIWHFPDGVDPFFQNGGQAPEAQPNTVVNNGLYTAPNGESFEGHFPVASPR